MAQWKEIEGYEGRYLISDEGEVLSLNYRRTNQIKKLKPIKNQSGYCGVMLTKNGTQKLFYVHRLVAQHFIPNPNDYPEVNHKDCDPTNNKVANLEWCDRFYNMSYEPTIENKRKGNQKRKDKLKARKILQCDHEQNIVQVWNSTSECAKKTQFTQSGINHALVEKYARTHYYKGFYWYFAKEE